MTKLAEAPGEVDLEEGLCTLRFQLQREEDAASEQAAAAAAAAGVVTIVVEVELGQQSTNYPFEPPVLRLLSGREHLPRANVSTDKDDGAAAGMVVVLPALAQWTPNTGLLDLLAALQEALGRGGQEEAEGESGGMTEAFEPGQALHTAKFRGPVFPCVVRQQGGGVLHRYVGVSDEWVLSLEADRTRMEWVAVVRAQPMLTVAKLKYRRGESITILFKGACGRHLLNKGGMDGMGGWMLNKSIDAIGLLCSHCFHQPHVTMTHRTNQTTPSGSCRWRRRPSAWRPSRRRSP